MDEYISRKAAIAKIREEGVYGSGYSNEEREDNVVDMLTSIPADEVERDEHRWIPVTEQLPEVGQRVMAVGLHGEAMYIGTYTGGIKETDYRKAKPYKIIAHGYGWRTFTWWMPLPEPPKEE